MKYLLLIVGFLMLALGLVLCKFAADGDNLWIPGLGACGLGIFAMVMPLAKRSA